MYFTSETNYAFRKLLFAVVPQKGVQSADEIWDNRSVSQQQLNGAEN